MRQVISIDTEKCTGCHICELVCSSRKYKAFNPRSSLIGVVSFGTTLDAALACQFCEKPTCVRVCPRKALTRNDQTGVILVDESRCTGCGWCAASCEFGAMTVDPGKKVITVCDLCQGKPECVQYCPQQALQLTTQEAISAKKRQTATLELTKQK